ncbi:unnamed protein product [Mytilus coruscus]|uniref:THD domain-containing protein n=1 Tax=Mytilus coruscus TaxID=42192 RepID=A0A6J8EJM9_MYTCO|nr:unnamed protein product [Mytilus coruscus]
MLNKLQGNLEEEKAERKDKSNTLCLPCNDLILGPLEHDNENIKLLNRKQEDGIQVCCAKGFNQTSILMDLLFKRREKLHHAQNYQYHQIFFSNLYKGQTTSNTSQALYHYVYRWNVFYPNDGNELLLKSVRTQCWAENRVYGDYTSYTSGVFKLSAGDNLYVKASKLDLISRDPKASFFGIAKL